MSKHLLLKCLFVSCVFLMLCPRKSILRLIPPPPPDIPLKMKQKSMETGWLMTELGYDFTDEEMERLKIWSGGIIPYYIDDYSYDKVLRERIRSMLKATNSFTNIRFVELNQPPDKKDYRWVFFINRRGQLQCSDVDIKNLTTKGIQRVILGYNCMSDADLAAVILAILGVPPQHNSPNRDEYFEVQRENILPGKENLFEKIRDSDWLFHDQEYDFNSIGHFSLHKHSKNGKATLKPVNMEKIPPYRLVSEPKHYSFYDLLKVVRMYNFITQKPEEDFPDCTELFVPGVNFTRYRPENGMEPKSRKKPNRYLGLPDDAKDEEEDKKEVIDDARSDVGGENASAEVTMEKLKRRTTKRQLNDAKSRNIDKLAMSDIDSD